MNYIGSKLSLLPFIEKVVIKEVGNLTDKVFCDLFAGTGVVGNYFKDKVLKIIANDFEYYAYVLNKNLIGNNSLIEFDFSIFDTIIDIDGFITNNYSLIGGRNYFTKENARKIDAIRIFMDDYKKDENLYYYLLASLLESADKIANTTSVYGAYLKKIKQSAQKKIVMKPVMFKITDGFHEVYQEDANELIKTVSGDVLYLDPPYNARQYGANYHLLNTIAEYKTFKPAGITGLPNYKKSNYCKKKEVLDMFESLIKDANFKFIFLSYNNEGLLSFDEIKNVMTLYGTYKTFKQKHKRYKADNNREYSAIDTMEYIHVLTK